MNQGQGQGQGMGSFYSCLYDKNEFCFKCLIVIMQNQKTGGNAEWSIVLFCPLCCGVIVTVHQSKCQHVHHSMQTSI